MTSDFETIQAKANKTIEIWGQVNVVVNNAGAGMLGISEAIG